MSTLARIFDRVRGQLAELGESIAGNLAQRELDEDIRTTDARLRELRAGLASLHAKRIGAQERIDVAVAAILQREAQALAALEVGEDALAHEVAAAIVQLEETCSDELAFMQQLAQQATQMRHLVEQAENALRRLQHQLDVLRAAETVQRAQETVAGRHSGEVSLPQTAVESLLRARRQHADTDAPEAEPDPQADPADLDARLRAAGIDDRNARAQRVLERIGQRLPPLARPQARRAKPAPRSSR